MPPDIDSLPRVRRALLGWHRAHGLPAPWRESGDPYQALVAAFMAQQTQMSRVTPSYRRFMAAFPTLRSLARARRGDVIRAWAGMGYNRRAVRLHEAARAIARDGWPRTAEGLERIDGVGPFTAAVVASFAFGERAASVDTNVRRVLGRLAGAEPLREKEARLLAVAALPAAGAARWNQALMDYGALVCTARPRCGECVVARWCASRERFAAGEPAGARRGPHSARRRQPPFEGSTRHLRGRIIDLLRALPPGRSLRVDRLPALLAQGRPPRAVDARRTRELVRALEREGLAAVGAGRVSLPQD